MATLLEQVTKDIADAMRQKDQATLAPLRMLKAALMNKEVEKGARPRRGRIPAGRQRAGQAAPRLDRAVPRRRASGSGRSRTGRSCVSRTVPAAVRPTKTTMQQAIEAAVAETGAAGPKDMGKVMKAVMTKLAGVTVDGRALSEAVKNAVNEIARQTFSNGARLRLVKGTQRASHPSSGQGPQPQGLRPLLFSAYVVPRRRTTMTRTPRRDPLALIGLATTSSRLLGLVRDQVQARFTSAPAPPPTPSPSAPASRPCCATCSPKAR